MGRYNANKLTSKKSKKAYFDGYRRGFGRCLGLVISHLRKYGMIDNEDGIRRVVLGSIYDVPNKKERQFLKKMETE